MQTIHRLFQLTFDQHRQYIDRIIDGVEDQLTLTFWWVIQYKVSDLIGLPRMSNTEPVVRLNVESSGDSALMREKTAEVLKILGA